MFLPLVFALAACFEYNPRPGTESEGEQIPDDTGPGVVADYDCDGQDDDGDGAADEDAADLDGDEIADCAECSTRSWTPSTVADVPACSAPPPALDPWAVRTLWSFETGEPHGCRVTSVADFDGDADADVFCVSQVTMRVLDGSTGAELWRTDEIAWLSPTVVADVDADGDLDVVGLDRDGRAVVLDATGTVRRRSNEPMVQPFFASGFDGVQRASLSVYSDGGVMALATGEAAARASGGDNLAEFHTDWDREFALLDHAAWDLDGDSSVEFLTKAAAYESDGVERWGVSVSEYRRPPFPVLLQADDDPDGEVLWLSAPDGGQLTDAVGEVLHVSALPDTTLAAAMACVGDVDGDASADVAFADDDYIYVWTPRGEEKWRAPVVDDTTYVGCTMFDFDGDGAKEVVVGAQEVFYILDGPTGEVRFEAMRSSLTVKDMPLVADVDADGSADIVMSNPGDSYRDVEAPDVVVYSNKNRDWPPGLPYWPYESWSGVGLWPDGTLRDDQQPPWLEYNIWRGQPEWVLWGTDLRAEIVDSCVAESPADDAEVRLSVRLVNLGPQTAPAGTPVAVYRVKANGSRVLREVLTTSEPLEAGYATATWEIVSNRSEAEHGFAFVAGHDGTDTTYKHDCDEANNEVGWMLP